MAFPCGSRTPGFNVTMTRAFMAFPEPMQDIRRRGETAIAEARLWTALMRHKRHPLNRHPEELGAPLALEDPTSGKPEVGGRQPRLAASACAAILRGSLANARSRLRMTARDTAAGKRNRGPGSFTL